MRSFQKVILLAGMLVLALQLSGAMNYGQIFDINIEGNNRIEEELIRSLLAFEIGDFLTTDATAKSIHNLYQLQVFDDVSVSITTLNQGIAVSVHIREFPVIRRLKFSGNRKLNDKKLQELAIIESGNYYVPHKEAEIESKILEEYKKKNYHYAQIEFIKKYENDFVDVTIEIDEGEKIVVKKVSIHGNHDFSDGKLRGKMATKKSGFFRSGKFEEDKFREDLQTIIDYYNKKGYIDAYIKSEEINIRENGFYIDIYLYEGKSYTFGSIDFEGNDVFKDEELKQNFKFEEDEVFNIEKFNAQIGNINSMYYEEGYIYSSIEPVQIKSGTKVNIKVSIQENTRAKIHKIHIRGNKQTKEKVIRRQLVIAPGDYFQQSRVRRSLSNIYNTGFFEPDLYPDYRIINKNGDIDLILNLNDKISGTANGGVALNSEDGLVGQFGISHNNLLGNSWQIALAWEFGGSTQNLDLSFTNPYFLDSNFLTGFNAYFATKEYDTYELRKHGGSLKLGLPISLVNRAKATFGYSYYRKKYSILEDTDEDEISDELQDLSDDGWKDNSSVSLTLSRDNRNNIYFPTSGTQLVLFTEVAGGILQGDNSYLKQIFQANWYLQAFFGTGLRTKWRFGYVTSYNNSSVPPDERFYLGGTGADGLRGYGDRSVGPTDEYGNNEGGKRSMLFSVEYVIPIVPDQVAIISFLDAGDCYNSFDKFNLWKLKKGIGLGVRIYSPFGLIGFDYAYNLANQTYEPHFQLGTTF